MKPTFSKAKITGRDIVEQDIVTKLRAGMSLEDFNKEMGRRDRTDRFWLIVGIVMCGIAFVTCIVWGVLS